MTTNEELATALERAAYGAVILNPGDFIEAARRLRANAIGSSLDTEHMAATGEVRTVEDGLRAEVERMRAERDEANERATLYREQRDRANKDGEKWWVRAVENYHIAALAMECGLAECERERAANDDLLRRILTLMDACDARDDRLARAEAVVLAARIYLRMTDHDAECDTVNVDDSLRVRGECNCGRGDLLGALAAWDGGNDG